MAKTEIRQTSFISGALSPDLLGRGDLVAYAQGAGVLENVFVQPTGGVYRRPGTVFVDGLSGDGRMAAFEQSVDNSFLIIFRDLEIDIYKDDALITTLAAPWTLSQLSHINWVQDASQLLVLHPDVKPQRIYINNLGVWVISNWVFSTSGAGAVWQPYHKFADDDVSLTAGAVSGSGIALSASADVFAGSHVGTRFQIDGKEVEIASVISPTSATINIIETLGGTSATTNWKEQAFSDVRGWPVSACFHQDRLVIGGSRDLSNRLWLSKIGAKFNFDAGTGLDDEAIYFTMLSDQANQVRAVFSGRHLQVFTSGAEWMVTGEPLTPGNIQVNRQTRIGSPTDRGLKPVDVDGATLFVSRTLNDLREFLFTDIEQAYQAGDLAMLARNHMVGPRDMDFDNRGRRLLLVMDDGSLAALTLYRAEKVTAWAKQTTLGNFRSLAVVGDGVYLLVERGGTYFVERLDDASFTDCSILQTSVTPKTTWDGLDHLEGDTVKLVADGVVVSEQVVTAGTVELVNPANSLAAGLAYSHIIEPLPPALASNNTSSATGRTRPIAMTFRLAETPALVLDTGRGLVNVPFRRFGIDALDQPQAPFSGDKKVRAFGWNGGAVKALWRIEQDIPLPFTLLAVSTEISLN
ncbi:MAG: hypothetical protein KAI27_05100 [Rhodospirillaceae bacterium]|nr:hypothetical protein [Rhodospirillaceae bacterium]